MSSRFLSYVLLACAASLSDASQSCDRSFTEQYRDCVRIVDSLRPDKGGQARVFAPDGSEFTDRPGGCKDSCTRCRRPACAATRHERLNCCERCRSC